MNILFFIGSFFPAQDGGPNNSIYWICKNLKKIKEVNNVDVITFYKGLDKHDIRKFKILSNKQIKISGIKIIYFKYYYIRILSPGFWYYLFFKLRNYNFAHLNSVFFMPNILFSLVLKFKKIPYCISLRGELEDEAIIYKKKLKKIYLKIVAFFYIKHSTFIHVTSNKEKKQAYRYIKNKKFINLPNLIDEKRKYYKPKFSKKNNLLYLGRIHPKKNLKYIISSFSNVINKISSKTKFIIVGSGKKKYENEISDLIQRENISNNVKMVGFKNRNKKINYFKKAKYLILASHSENFGNVILESLENQTPVLVSNNLPWKIIDSMKLGYYFHIKNLEKIIIKSFNIKINHYKKFFLNRKKFLNKFNAQTNIHKYFNAYKKYST